MISTATTYTCETASQRSIECPLSTRSGHSGVDEPMSASGAHQCRLESPALAQSGRPLPHVRTWPRTDRPLSGQRKREADAQPLVAGMTKRPQADLALSPEWRQPQMASAACSALSVSPSLEQVTVALVGGA